MPAFMLGSLSGLLKLPDSTAVLHLSALEDGVTQTALASTFSPHVRRNVPIVPQKT